MLEHLYIGFYRLMARLGLPLHGTLMYIGGSDTLPPPLSKEEENRLMDLLENEGCRRMRAAGVKYVPDSLSTTSDWWSTYRAALRTQGSALKI